MAYDFEKYKKYEAKNFEYHSQAVYKILSKSVPEKLDSIKFSSEIYRSTGDWTFKFRTQYGNYYITSCDSMGHINWAWYFLDALCLKKDEIFWDIDQEGKDAMLYAKNIDDENVRLCLFSNGWWAKEPLPNPAHKEDGDFDKDENYYIPLQFDFVVKRSALISALDIELRDGFSWGNKDVWNNSFHDVWTEKLYTEEVMKYFSPEKDMSFDKYEWGLYNFLRNPYEILEEALKKGFNPNVLYISKKSNAYGGVTPLIVLANNHSSAEEGLYEKCEGLIDEYEKASKLIKLQKIKLFLQYGADPNFNSPLHIWSKTALETAISSHATLEIIETLLAHGAKDTNLCWEIAKNNLRYKEKYYADVYKLLEKYGEQTKYSEWGYTGWRHTVFVWKWKLVGLKDKFKKLFQKN